MIARDTERDNFKSAEAARDYGLVDEVLEPAPGRVDPDQLNPRRAVDSRIPPAGR